MVHRVAFALLALIQTVRLEYSDQLTKPLRRPTNTTIFFICRHIHIMYKKSLYEIFAGEWMDGGEHPHPEKHWSESFLHFPSKEGIWFVVRLYSTKYDLCNTWFLQVVKISPATENLVLPYMYNKTYIICMKMLWVRMNESAGSINFYPKPHVYACVKKRWSTLFLMDFCGTETSNLFFCCINRQTHLSSSVLHQTKFTGSAKE